MRNESVAVLDIRSCEVTFLIGARGVNGTFVFRGSKTERYVGYTASGFIDVDSFKEAASSCMNSVLQNYDGQIKKLFVAVPSAFVQIQTKEQTISFPTKRKLSSDSFDDLFQAGLSELFVEGRCVKRTGVHFSIGDQRKYFSEDELYGVPTSVLKGSLCYYFAKESFFEAVEPVLDSVGFAKIEYVPQTLSTALYLLPQKTREGYAFLLDVGFSSTSLSAVYGNGVVREETFACGTVYVILSLMENLGVSYEKAEEILQNANVSGGAIAKDVLWTDSEGSSYSVAQINDIVKCGLDDICERVDAFFAKYYRSAAFGGAHNPLSLTGEGVTDVKGGVEHISKRLGRLCQTVCPDVPYYDKPAYSSRIALLSHALSRKERGGLKKILFNIFGGNKK